MSIPKRHHFVPQMLLRRFADADGRLFFFDKRIADKGVQKASPDNIFLQRHLYTQYEKDGTKDVSAERHFAQLEGEADRIIDKITQQAELGKLPRLTTAERKTWDQFFYYQWKRTPDSFLRSETLADFDEALDWAIDEYEQAHRPLTDKEKQDLEHPDAIKRIAQNARVQAVTDPGKEVQDIMARKALGIVLLAKPNKSFVIGSYPIVRFAPGTHLSDPRAGMWLPVAHNIAITPAPGPGHLERFLTITDD